MAGASLEACVAPGPARNIGLAGKRAHMPQLHRPGGARWPPWRPHLSSPSPWTADRLYHRAPLTLRPAIHRFLTGRIREERSGESRNYVIANDPRTVQHQQRAMFEHGVTEAEFDAYVGVRHNVWQGESVSPLKPLPPSDGRTPHYVDIGQRLGAGPEASPSATPVMSPPGQTASSPTQAPPPPPPVEPPPQAPAAPVRRASVPSEPPTGAEAPGAAPDPVRPAPERPAPPTREPVRPEPPRPEPSPPEVRRPEPARPVATRPTPEPPVAPARIAPERVKPARRFLDFFTRR
jgi:hypothetical protein